MYQSIINTIVVNESSRRLNVLFRLLSTIALLRQCTMRWTHKIGKMLVHFAFRWRVDRWLLGCMQQLPTEPASPLPREREDYFEKPVENVGECNGLIGGRALPSHTDSNVVFFLVARRKQRNMILPSAVLPSSPNNRLRNRASSFSLRKGKKREKGKTGGDGGIWDRLAHSWRVIHDCVTSRMDGG